MQTGAALRAGEVSRESLCRSCEAPIIFVRLLSGRYNPCDAHSRQLVREDPDGTPWVTTSGMVITAVPAEEGDVGVMAYRSHFATCPNAGQHRRKGKK